jgi:hypothetical protein
MNEEELSRAAARAAELLNEALPKPEDCNHTFSPRFRRKMRHLLFRQNHPVLTRALQSAAVLFLTITVLFGSLLTVSTDAREFVFGWVRGQFGSGFIYTFDGDAAPSEIPQYCLGWIPDGYTQDFTSELEGGKILIYGNAEGKQMLFAYSSASTGTVFALHQTDDCIQEDVSINGMTGTIYVSPRENEPSAIVWIDPERNIVFDIGAVVDPQALIKMAENVTEK